MTPEVFPFPLLLDRFLNRKVFSPSKGRSKLLLLPFRPLPFNNSFQAVRFLSINPTIQYGARSDEEMTENQPRREALLDRVTCRSIFRKRCRMQSKMLLDGTHSLNHQRRNRNILRKWLACLLLVLGLLCFRCFKFCSKISVSAERRVLWHQEVRTFHAIYAMFHTHCHRHSREPELWRKSLYTPERTPTDIGQARSATSASKWWPKIRKVERDALSILRSSITEAIILFQII